MKIQRIDCISIPTNRQRKTFDEVKMREFAAGIEKRGLLHPIILRNPAAGQFILVAGERRLRAIGDLSDFGTSITHDGEPVPLGHIPYTLLSDLSPLAAEEAELEENTHREDLTWQERSAATARLFELRKAQAVTANLPEPTTTDLSHELRGESDGYHSNAVRKEIILAKHLANPAIAAAKTVDEAFKILKRAEETERNRALGESVGRTHSANSHSVINTDALTWLKEADAGQFDVICTDPPYGVGADEFSDSGTIGGVTGAHTYIDDYATFNKILSVCSTEFIRITKPEAHLYWFCDFGHFPHIAAEFTAAGWWVFRTPLIWFKPNAPRAPWPQHGPQRKYECCLFAVKGKKLVTKMAGDVLEHSPDSNLGHQAQKPVSLFTDLLSRSVRPGDAVLDPFAGSGPILPAAHLLKCIATAVEMNTGNYGIILNRLKALDAEPELPL
mgnify:CR=1 FL=1